MTDSPRALEIEVDRSLPNLFGHFVNRSALPDACVADQKIYASKLIDGFLNQPHCFIQSRNVSLNRQRFDASELSRANRIRCRLLVSKIVNDNIRAEPGKTINRGSANT